MKCLDIFIYNKNNKLDCLIWLFWLRVAGFESVSKVYKVGQGHPDIPELLASDEIHMVVNTAAGRRAARDAPSIRLAALDRGILYFTTIPGAYAAAEAVATLRRGPLSVRALQDDTGGPPPWAASLME